MRLGVIWHVCPNANYRAVHPMREMQRRGHTVVTPDEHGAGDLKRLAGCDVVHVYRRGDPETRRLLEQLARRGTAVTYDNDDDLSTLPQESPGYKKRGGLVGERIFKQTMQVARLADAFTTPSELLAEKYRRGGVTRAEVIGNYLSRDAFRPPHRHDGVVIGWIAGAEHRADTARIQIAAALRRLMAEHANVRVECIGIDLGLTERYRHDQVIPFPDLPKRIGGFDIGIAPLADIPWNRARSDIKLKEYAASGVPWLASPVGPYADLGEAQGGRLVPDDAWFEALERLVTRKRERRRLARKAKAWAKRQTIEAGADRWEALFASLAERRG
jgi:glycosyltransferase involved in cell wall biosynthesis